MRFLGFTKMDYLKHLLVTLAVISLIACSGGDGGIGGGTGSVALSWKAPVMREDGADLPLIQIAGYRIYYGVETGKYFGRINVDDRAATRGQLAKIPVGTYFVVMTAVDIEGIESAFSPEVKVVL